MDSEEDKLYYTQYLLNHRRKYGNNLIVEGNRIPKTEYMLLDKRLFSDYNPVFDSCWKEKSLYPLYLLGYSDFCRCFGL